MGQPDPEVVRRAIAFVRILHDPALPGLLVFSVFMVAGVVTLVVSGFMIKDLIFVPQQVPTLISGGFTERPS